MYRSIEGGLRHGDRHLGGGRRMTILIVVAALLLAAIAWATALFQSRFESRAAEQAAIAQVTFRAMMLQQYVARTLDAANIATLHVADLDRRGDGGALRGRVARPALISGPIARNPAFLGLSIADARGDIVATTLRQPGRMMNVRTHPAFAAHLSRDTDALFVSKPGLSRLLGRNTIWLSRRLSGPGGRFDGVVAINMDPAQLTGIYDDATMGASDVAWVVGLDGVMRSRRAQSQISSGEDVTSTGALRLQARAPHGSYLGRDTLDGRPRYLSQRRIADYPLFVSYSILQEDVLRPARLKGQQFLLAAALVTILDALLAVILIRALRRREKRAVEPAAAKNKLEEAQRVGRIGDWAFRLNSDESRWSPELFRLYERDPVLGAPSAEAFADWLHPESAQSHWDAVARTLETGVPSSWEVMAGRGRSRDS